MHVISTFFIIILFGHLTAQEILWGEELKFKGKSTVKRIFGESESQFFTVNTSYKTFSDPVAHLNQYTLPSMNLVKEEKIEITSLEGESELKNIFQLENKMFCIQTSIDYKEKKYRAFIKEIGSANQPKLLAEMSFFRNTMLGEFEFVLDKESSRLMIVASPAYDKYSKEKFTLLMYNSSLTLEWEKKIELPYLDSDFTILRHKVDQNGNVYLLTSYKEIDNKARKGDQLPIDEYMVLAYNKDQNRIKEFNIKLKDKWVNGLTINLSKDENLLIGGFFSTEKTYSVAGTFFLEIDKTSLDISKKSLNPFTKEFLGKFFTDQQLKKENQLDNFYFDHFILSEDGSSYFTAEQYYIRTTSYYDFRTGQTNYTYNYYYNDIIVVKIGEDAKVKWAERVAKKQVTTNDRGYFSSYLVMPNSENGINILYNDNPKNFDDKPDERLKIMNTPQKSVAALAQIDADGKVSYKPLFNSADYSTILRPKINRVLPSGKLLVFTQKSRSHRFATIDFSK